MASAERAFDGMSAVAPRLTSSLVEGYSQKIQQLLADWPKTLNNSLVPSRRSDQPSSNELEKAESMWKAAFSPLQVFSDFSRGLVDYEAVSALARYHPELMRTAQLATIDLLQHVPSDAPVPDGRVAQLDLFLNMQGALDDTLSSGFMATMSQIGQKQATEEEQGSSVKSNQAKTATLFETPVSKRMTGAG